MNSEFATATLVSAAAFQAQKPYPWSYMRNILTEQGWNSLRASLPDIAEFDLMVGVKRAHGQAPHNRGILHYRAGMVCAEPWNVLSAFYGNTLISIDGGIESHFYYNPDYTFKRPMEMIAWH